MKFRWILISSVTVFIFFSFNAVFTHADTLYVKKEKVNFRDAPKGDKLGQLLQGTELKVIEGKGEWVKVTITGWIYKPLLTKNLAGIKKKSKNDRTPARKGGPSNKDIKQAIRRSLEQKVPASLANYLTGGENAKVKEIRVIKVGRVQGEGSNKYWPVKIHAKGTCTVMFGGRQGFEGKTEYIIKMDPYGEWVARPSGL